MYTPIHIHIHVHTCTCTCTCTCICVSSCTCRSQPRELWFLIYSCMHAWLHIHVQLRFWLSGLHVQWLPYCVLLDSVITYERHVAAPAGGRQAVLHILPTGREERSPELPLGIYSIHSRPCRGELAPAISNNDGLVLPMYIVHVCEVHIIYMYMYVYVVVCCLALCLMCSKYVSEPYTCMYDTQRYMYTHWMCTCAMCMILLACTGVHHSSA